MLNDFAAKVYRLYKESQLGFLVFGAQYRFIVSRIAKWIETIRL